jgi:ribosomal protein S27E
MYENAQRMSCGHCGYSRFTIYQIPKGLVVECQECHDTTEVQARAELQVDGDLCTLNEPKD